MTSIEDSEVAEVFANYPSEVREKLLSLRALIFSAAREIQGVGLITETLKWGEPSYLVKGGSTIRIGWKTKTPEQYHMYFNCNTKLVDTFRELYGDDGIRFEGNRAIVFHKDDPIPSNQLKHCVSLALTYHGRKHLPLLGA